MNHSFHASDGTRLAYRLEGSGTCILCLAGLTRNATDFDYALPFLKGFQVLRPDYRGRGASAWSGADSYTIQREAQDVVELLDHLNIGKAAIIGTSRGGIISMWLATMMKERMLGVLLNDIGPEIDPAGIAEIAKYVGKNPAVKTLEEAAATRASLLPGFANVPDSRWLEEAERHFVQTPNGLTVNYDPELALAFMRAYEAPPVDMWPLFDALEGLPLALVRGANSDLLSEETFAAMKARRPDIIAANVPDRGHIPFLDEPEAVAVIGEFLGKLP